MWHSLCRCSHRRPTNQKPVVVMRKLSAQVLCFLFAAKNVSEPLKFWQISDVHLDYFYSPTGNPKDNCHPGKMQNLRNHSYLSIKVRPKIFSSCEFNFILSTDWITYFPSADANFTSDVGKFGNYSCDGMPLVMKVGCIMNNFNKR